MQADYLNHMGTDLTVVNAARVSFASESTKLNRQDEGLIQFLARGCMSKVWDDALDCITGEDDLGTCSREQANDLLKWAKNMPTHWTPFSHPMISIRETVPIFVARQR